jgi:Tol biopolymer transport system component
MTTLQRLERDLPTILGELTLAPYPDYIDDVLSTTAQRRQRPTWTFPGRWLPVELTTQRVPTTGVPWRQVGVLALIGILIAAAAAAYVGSQRRLPAPFGVAANGVIGYHADGILYLHDPADGTTRSLTTIPDAWENPWFSPDGTQIVVARPLNDTEVEFGVLPVDGGDGTVRVITPAPVNALGWIDFSPDGGSVLLDSIVDGAKAISTIDLATGVMRTFALERGAYRPTYLAPDGARILFAFAASDGPDREDIAIMDADGTNVRTIFEATTDTWAFDFPRGSPDGTQIAYSVWDAVAKVAHVHIAATDDSGDRIVANAPGVSWTAWPLFSPDGRTLAVEQIGPEDVRRIAFVDVADGSVRTSSLTMPQGASKEWAPDGSTLLVTVNDTDGRPLPQVVVDPATGAVSASSSGATSYPAWQRRAP